MTKEQVALKLALEALENWFRFDFENFGEVDYKAVAAIKEALAQPEQEPVACKECHLKDTVYDLLGDLKVANLKLSVRAQRTWVELTMDDFTDILKLASEGRPLEIWELFKAVENKLKEKNT